MDEYMRDDYIQHNGDCPQGKAGFVEFFDVIFRRGTRLQVHAEEHGR